MRALNQCPVVQFGQRPQHLHRQEGMIRHRRRTAGVECRLAVGGSVWALWLMVPLKKKAPAEAGGKEGKGAKETRGAGGLGGVVEEGRNNGGEGSELGKQGRRCPVCMLVVCMLVVVLL